MAFSIGYTEFEEAFRNFVLDDVDVADLIESRFFGTELATIRNPVFPSAYFTPQPGDDTLGFIQRFEVLVRAYSKVTFVEANQVFDAIRTRLNYDVRVLPTVIVRPVGTPARDYDEISRLYTISGRFRVIRFIKQPVSGTNEPL